MPSPLRVLFQLSALYLFILFSSTANAQTTKVEELLSQLKNTDPDTTQIKVMRKLSAAYSAVDPEKKYYYANRYRLMAEKNGIDSIVSAGYLDMGISFGIRSKMDSALYYFNLGYKIAKESNYIIGIGRSHANIGYAYDRLDRKKEAVSHYEQSLKIFKKLNIKKSINQSIINLGALYSDLGEFSTAHSYFLQVLENLKSTPDDEIGLGGALFSLGNTSRELGKHKQALVYLQKSLAIREKIGDLNGIALSNWGIARLLIDQKQYKKALKNLDIALKHNRTLKNLYHETAVLVSIARAHLGLNDFKKAEEAADLALQRAKETSSKIPVNEALEVLIDVNRAQKKYAEALKFQSDYIKVNDSLDASETKKGVIINDLHRVNTENKILEKDNKKISSANTYYVFVISIITILLTIVAILLILYYKRNLEKKAFNALLQKQKQEIAQANEELGALNDELNAQMDIVSIQNTELGKLNAVKNKFFSIVSHDLRSPLGTLKMLFQLYRKGDLTKSELDELLSKLEDTIHTTASFLDNLLEWSKSQLEGIIVKPSVVNLHDIADENIKLTDTQIRSKNLMVYNNISREITAFADPDMINVVVRNLLSNAVKFCNSGDQITFDATIESDCIAFSIADTGPGMSEENQKSLFNLAHTVSEGTAGEKGYHIGLILCRDMILQNNGTIEVNSTLGKGTTFHITLPFS